MGALRRQEGRPLAPGARAGEWCGPQRATLLARAPPRKVLVYGSGTTQVVLVPRLTDRSVKDARSPSSIGTRTRAHAHVVPSPNVHRAGGAHPSPRCPLHPGLGLLDVFVLRLPCLGSLWKVGPNHPHCGSEPPSHPGKAACVCADTQTHTHTQLQGQGAQAGSHGRGSARHPDPGLCPEPEQLQNNL